MADFDCALNKLSPIERRIIFLYGQLGMSLTDIAKLVERDRNTVKRHYDRAIVRLNAFLVGKVYV